MRATTAPFRYVMIHCRKSISIHIFRFHLPRQKIDLIKNIEKLTFWAGENDQLHYAKQELLSQINNLDISISGKGFFIINRQFLAGVSHLHSQNRVLLS